MFSRPVNDIRWSSDSYNIRQLMTEYPAPLLVRVTQGHCSAEDADSLGQGQVIRIHRWLRQQRVIARDARGRHISIPLDLDMAFEVFPDKRRSLSKPKTMSLINLTRQYSLPRKVRFSPRHLTSAQLLDAGNLGVRISLEPLELIRLHQEIYLNGNSVNFGELDPTVLSVPIPHDLEMSVALGLNSGDRNWNRLMRELDNVVAKKVRFATTYGNKKITYYHSEDENVIIPTETSSVQRRHGSLGRAFYFGTLQRKRAGKPNPKSATVDAGIIAAQRSPVTHTDIRRKFAKRKDSHATGTSTSISSVSGSTTTTDSRSGETFWFDAQDDTIDNDIDYTHDIDDQEQCAPPSLFGSVSRLSIFNPKLWGGSGSDSQPSEARGRAWKGKYDRRSRTSLSNVKTGMSLSMVDLQRLRKQSHSDDIASGRGFPDGRSAVGSTSDDDAEIVESTDL